MKHSSLGAWKEKVTKRDLYLTLPLIIVILTLEVSLLVFHGEYTSGFASFMAEHVQKDVETEASALGSPASEPFHR